MAKDSQHVQIVQFCLALPNVLHIDVRKTFSRGCADYLAGKISVLCLLLMLLIVINLSMLLYKGKDVAEKGSI